MTDERAVEVLQAWNLNQTDEFTPQEFEEAFYKAIEALKGAKMKIYINCRQEFIDAVEEVFPMDNIFDFIENEDYSNNYDCFITDSDECYIINRSTGEYINWYKFTHVGRDIHSTVSPDKFVEFLTKFKRSSIQN